MKKGLKILLLIIGLIIIVTALFLLYPTINVKHEINDFNLSFKLPKHYKKIDAEENIVKYSSQRTGVNIEVYSFEKSFLSEVGTTEKLENYVSLLKAVKYDSVLQNEERQMIEISEMICAKVSVEVKTLERINKEVTIIIPKEKDVIFTIYGTKDVMNKYENEIEKIIGSIKIK